MAEKRLVLLKYVVSDVGKIRIKHLYMYIIIIIICCQKLWDSYRFFSDHQTLFAVWKNRCLSNLQISEGSGMGDSEMLHAEGRSGGV